MSFVFFKKEGCCLVIVWYYNLLFIRCLRSNLRSLVTSIQTDFYNRERRAGYKTLAHSTLRTRLSNLFDAVRGNSGKTATALTYITTNNLDLSKRYEKLCPFGAMLIKFWPFYPYLFIFQTNPNSQPFWALIFPVMGVATFLLGLDYKVSQNIMVTWAAHLEERVQIGHDMRGETLLELLAARFATWFQHHRNHELLWASPWWLDCDRCGFLNRFVSFVADLLNFNSARLKEEQREASPR